MPILKKPTYVEFLGEVYKVIETRQAGRDLVIIPITEPPFGKPHKPMTVDIHTAHYVTLDDDGNVW